MVLVDFREGCKQCDTLNIGEASITAEATQLHMIAHALQDLAEVKRAELQMKMKGEIR
jgi:hypothetical protein